MVYKPPPHSEAQMTALPRRAVLAAAVSLRTAHASAQTEKPVFLGYSQKELDLAYDQRAWAPEAASLIRDYTARSEAVRRVLPPRTERYGDSDAEALDVFGPKDASGAPVIVFLHGGAWRMLTRSDVSSPAPTFVDRGGIYVAPDFGPVQQTGLAGMAEQCRAALAWVVRNAGRFGGDPNRVHVAGHSSGAHLAAVLLTTDWKERGLPPDAIKGGLLMSGIYDLHPALLSARSSYIHPKPGDEVALSPIRHLDRVRCPVAVSWADQDSPEFRRQSRVLADTLAGMGRLASRHVLFNTNHFQEPQQLDSPDSVLSGVALRMMGLA